MRVGRQRSGRVVRGDGGAASVLVVGVLVAVVVALGAGLAVAALLLDQSRVRTAADLSAIAGALAARGAVAGGADGAGPGCGVAREAAGRNGVTLATCTVDGAVVAVTVTARSGLATVSASATAGPAFAR